MTLRSSPISSPPADGLLWMDALRGVSMMAVIIHHWLKFIPAANGSSTLFSAAAELIGEGAGTFVHLFFFLSGCGLTLSYLKKADASWKSWASRRLERILIPYWVFVLLAFLWASVFTNLAPEIFPAPYSLHTLFAYLTLTRNFYPPGFLFNPTLWFMPVIFGMYLIFPVLIWALKRWGLSVFLVSSFLVTDASITVALFAGYPDDHQGAIFLFHLLEFSLGMAMGWQISSNSGFSQQFVGLKPFLVGFVFCSLSLVIVRWWDYGPAYNDSVTLIGVFLIASNICRWMLRRSPHILGTLLKKISEASYLMYLLHGPLILYVAQPLILRFQIRMTPTLVIFGGLLMGATTYFLARVFSPPLTRITSRLANLSSIGPKVLKG